MKSQITSGGRLKMRLKMKLVKMMTAAGLLVFSILFFSSRLIEAESVFSDASTPAATAAAAAAVNTFTIGGSVRADGANLAGATVVLSGSQSQTATTDAAGNYSFTAEAGGSYTISVYKNGYNFNPTWQTVSDLQADQTANFQNGTQLCAPPPVGSNGGGSYCSNPSFTNATPNGKILFVSQRTGNDEIFVMNNDGGNQTNLTDNSALDAAATWSPDGSKIAFVSTRHGNVEIYTMNADGSNVTRLTNNSAVDDHPAWSPDGSKIVFTSNRDGSFQIYIMNADGSGAYRPLLITGNNSAPKWSSTNIIAFESTYRGDYDIFTMNPDGTGFTYRIGITGINDQFPAWTPDGFGIYYQSFRNIGGGPSYWQSRYQCFPSGCNVEALGTNFGSGHYQYPSITSGYGITFTHDNGGGPNDIWKKVGDTFTRLTTASGNDYYSHFQPNATVRATPNSNVSLTFSNVTTAGNTAATSIAPASAGALPVGYRLTPQSVAYDIRSSAVFSSTTVTINVPSVPDAATCTSLQLLHYRAAANRLERITSGRNYNSSTQVCALSGGASTLSPFVVAQAIYSVSGQITLGGNTLPNVSVALSGASSATATTDAAGNYSFSNLPEGGNYTVTPTLANFAFTPTSRNFTIFGNQTANFTAVSTCTYAINPASNDLAWPGGAGSISLTTQTGCAWTAASNAAWITITGGASGNASGTINYSVASNPGAARSGTITAGGQTFTINQAEGLVNVAIPTSLTALKNTTLTAPVNVGETTGKGVIAYDFRITYDPAVLTPLAAPYDKAGTMSAGFEVAVNASTPGTLIVSGFGANPLTGSGTLLNLKFNAVGNISSCGALNFTAFQFNEGEPHAVTSNGQACVIAGEISGTIVYGTSETAVSVPNVALTAAGTPNVSAATAADGAYALTGLGAGAYTVTPSKTGEANNAVSALDASLVSQFVIGSITFNANQQTAADTSGNGSITSYDAGLTAQYVVGLSNPDSRAGTWKFVPASREYPNVEANQTDQNYTAILMGEVSGNWTPPAPPAAVAESEQSQTELANAVAVSLPTMTATRNRNITLPVTVGDVTGRNVLAYQFDVVFDPAVLQPQAAPVVQAETLSANFTVVANAQTPGRLRVAAFGTQALAGQGTLLKLNFRVVGQAGSNTDLTWQGLQFNESQPPAAGTAGRISVTASASSQHAYDFDGDGKADISVFRPENGVWYQMRSTEGFAAAQFGISTDKLAPADFDGDGKTDLAVFRDGIWYLLRSQAGFASVQFGIAGDIPQPADFDGDGRAEISVYRGGHWFVLNLANGQFSAGQFGVASDKPVVADYDGDGKADYAVYRPANGVWYLLRSTEGFGAAQFGISTDKPVVGDYDGDGKADQAVYRDGTWYLNRSRDGFAAAQFGIATDVPVPADYDGDGKTDLAVYRSGNWYLLQTTSGFAAGPFGISTDKPVPNAFVP